MTRPARPVGPRVDPRISDVVALRQLNGLYFDEELTVGVLQVANDLADRRHHSGHRERESVQTAGSVLPIPNVVHPRVSDRAALLWIVELAAVVGQQRVVAASTGVGQQPGRAAASCGRPRTAASDVGQSGSGSSLAMPLISARLDGLAASHVPNHLRGSGAYSGVPGQPGVGRYLAGKAATGTCRRGPSVGR